MRKIHLPLLALLMAAAPAWAGSVTAPETITIVSADGTIITPPTGAAPADAAAAAVSKIVTVEGVWTFGTPPNAAGDYPVLLNGSNAGWAVLLEVLNGNLYAVNKAANYSVRWNSGWANAGATGPVEGTVATKMTLVVTLPKIPDNSPAGTVVAKATVTMSPASAKFTGPLVSSNPFYEAQGLNLVLTRGLTPADDGLHPATITAIQ